MKAYVLLTFLITVTCQAIAQTDDRELNYRPTTEKRINLIHTRLEASFDYARSRMKGNVSLTLRPYFYPTDSVHLDAKGMDIHRVSSTGKDLIYAYNGMVLAIKLDRTYRADEQLTLDIQYTAKPSEFQAKGSAAINDARGMYFIHPQAALHPVERRTHATWP